MPRVPLAVEPDHPAFEGHFPGHPIVPGVLLLDRAQRAVETATGLSLCGLPAAKFLSPAQPGDPLELAYEVDAGTVRFEILSGTRTIASGRFLTKAAR
jgi:3-hydroxymyristoyl/3-hydroxydecanoyl-(acyl carrier protein) dehydratase